MGAFLLLECKGRTPISTFVVATAIAATVVALLLQRLFISRYSNHPVGDESEYLERAVRADPFDPTPFVRMPLLIAISVLLRGNQRRMALAMSLASATGVAITATVGATAQGFWIWAPLTLWLLLPERVALSHRVWPESVLTSLAAVLAGLLLFQPPYATALIGLVGAIAVATRIDAIAWTPLASIALIATASLTAVDWVVLVGPTITVLVLLSVRNWLCYRIPLPETTFLFNLLVMANDKDTIRPLSTHLTQTLTAWISEGTFTQQASLALRSAARLVTSPWATLTGFGRRLLSLLGHDTFVGEILLNDRRDTPWLRILLPFGASVLLGSAIAGALWLGPNHFWYALPAAGATLTTSAVHTRTRFRQPLVPVAVLVLADACARAGTDPAESVLALLLACSLGSALAILGTRLAPRGERDLS